MQHGNIETCYRGKYAIRSKYVALLLFAPCRLLGVSRVWGVGAAISSRCFVAKYRSGPSRMGTEHPRSVQRCNGLLCGVKALDRANYGPTSVDSKLNAEQPNTDLPSEASYQQVVHYAITLTNIDNIFFTQKSRVLINKLNNIDHSGCFTWSNYLSQL